MIDHIGIPVGNIARATEFYLKALAPLGISRAARTTALPACVPTTHANYYGAFVLDPDGHNIEAVCHAPALK
jgi:catechol 2,3-dioxygenase-like lactoylglutathione lyase family enzyme